MVKFRDLWLASRSSSIPPKSHLKSLALTFSKPSPLTTSDGLPQVAFSNFASLTDDCLSSLKTIQEELGGVSYDEEIEEMRLKSKSKKWDTKVGEHFNKELGKLQRMNPQVAEYSIQRNYLDLFFSRNLCSI